MTSADSSRYSGRGNNSNPAYNNSPLDFNASRNKPVIIGPQGSPDDPMGDNNRRNEARDGRRADARDNDRRADARDNDRRPDDRDNERRGDTRDNDRRGDARDNDRRGDSRDNDRRPAWDRSRLNRNNSNERERDRRDAWRDRERDRNPGTGKEWLGQGGNNGGNLMYPDSSTPMIGAGSMMNQQWNMMYPMMGMNSDPGMMGMNSDPSMMAMQPDPTMAPMPSDSTMMGMPNADPSMVALMQQMGYGEQFPYNMMGDPSAMGMVPMMCNPVKEIIRCKECVLYPPNPNAPQPPTRERPPGCKTVFVGGLPELVTEEIIRDVFEQCGPIQTIRMSKKNFCHVRYEGEQFVDYAIFLSGYRMRIEDKMDNPNTGRLHVDYAQAKDDTYEWECNQRALQREQRHHIRMEQDRLRPPSPPPITHYSEHEAQMLIEKLKGDEDFQKCIQMLQTWLERGDCNKRNCGTFYSMVQSANSHVRRLLNERTMCEEELKKARDMMQQRMQGVLVQFTTVQKVFSAASHQKVWDHFTKAQRKNISMWKKQAEELKNAHLEEVINDRQEDEMELSDSEDVPPTQPRSEEPTPSPQKKPRFEVTADQYAVSRLTDQVQSLQEQNDSLRCQLEAYKNEVDMVKGDNSQDLEEKDKRVKTLQQAMQGMQQQLLSTTMQRSKDEQKIKQLEQKLRESMTAASAAKKSEESKESDKEEAPAKSTDGGETAEEEQSEQKKKDAVIAPSVAVATSTNSLVSVTERDAKLIGLAGTFLHVHPFGASVDYIWSYLQKLEPGLRPSDVEGLLLKFPSVFNLEFCGVGASLERKWTFTAFEKYRSKD